MNVLSLFDGMSCGRVALERCGFEISKYYAAEIDKYAIQIALNNYPDTIPIGDVTKVFAKDLAPIDLLIGGSPCQGFSFAGKQLNFEDPRSMLFFEFVRLLKECKPKYFFLENVVMKKEYQDVISKYLGAEPIMLNSSLVSAQSRKRLYWTNIPGYVSPEDKGILLKDIIEGDVDENLYINQSLVINTHITKNYLQYDMNCTGHKSQSQRAYYINSKSPCLSTKSGTDTKIIDRTGKVRRITRLEGERLQNIPRGYTQGVTRKDALFMLGNGWTVDAVCEFFKHIPKDIDLF